jgi:hypothetical protein
MRAQSQRPPPARRPWRHRNGRRHPDPSDNRSSSRSFLFFDRTQSVFAKIFPVWERSSLIVESCGRGHLWRVRETRHVHIARVSAKLAAIEPAIVALPLRQWPEGVLTKRAMMHVRTPFGPKTHVLTIGSPEVRSGAALVWNMPHRGLLFQPMAAGKLSPYQAKRDSRRPRSRAATRASGGSSRTPAAFAGLRCLPGAGHMVHQTATAEIMTAIDMAAQNRTTAAVTSAA